MLLGLGIKLILVSYFFRQTLSLSFEGNLIPKDFLEISYYLLLSTIFLIPFVDIPFILFMLFRGNSLQKEYLVKSFIIIAKITTAIGILTFLLGLLLVFIATIF